MKHLLLCAALVASTFQLLFAQQTIIAHNTPDGIFLHWPQAPESGQTWRLERLDDRSSSKKIADIEAPKSLKQLRKREQGAFADFPNQNPIPAALIDTLWRRSGIKALEFDGVRFPALQIAFGQAWHDKTARPGVTYRYRLLQNGKVVAQSQAFAREQTTLTADARLFRHTSNGTHIALRGCLVPANRNIAWFKVLRSPLGQNHYTEVSGFRRLTTRNDSTLLLFRDDTPDTFGFYAYKIIPYDWLGNVGPISPVYTGDNLNETTQPFVTRFKAKEAPAARAVRLSWRLGNPERLNGLTLFRSQHWDTGYQRVAELSPSDTAYTDRVNLANEAWYYYLGLNDVTGKVFLTHKIFAIPTRTETPAPPVALQAQPKGRDIQLSWQHPDAFINGFQLLRADAADNPLEFHPVSSFLQRDTAAATTYTFADTSAELRGDHTYAYCAIARNDGFAFSDHSDTVYVRPNRRVSITAMQFRSPVLAPDSNQVMLVWENRAETMPNLSRYRLYRKTAAETDFDSTRYTLVDAKYNTMIDKNLTPNTTYYYMLRAEDIYGNLSPNSLPLKVRLEKSLVAVRRLFAEPTTDGIELHWADLREVPGVQSFQIWRKAGDAKAALVGEVPAGTSVYKDEKVAPHTSYCYYITVLNASGETSAASPTAVVQW